jgi:hypothetical protein
MDKYMFYKESVPIAIGMKTKMSESVALSFSLRTLRSIFSANFAVKNREEKKIKTRFPQFSALIRSFPQLYDILRHIISRIHVMPICHVNKGEKIKNLEILQVYEENCRKLQLLLT